MSGQVAVLLCSCQCVCADSLCCVAELGLLDWSVEALFYVALLVRGASFDVEFSS